MTGDTPRRESYVPAKLVEDVARTAIRDFVFEEVGELRQKIDAIAGYMRKQANQHNSDHKLAEEELQGHFDTIVKLFDDQTQKNDMQDLKAIDHSGQLAKLVSEIELDFENIRKTVDTKFSDTGDAIGEVYVDMETLEQTIKNVKSQLPKMEKEIQKAIDTKFNSLEKTQTKAAKDAESKHVALARQNGIKFEQLDKVIQTYQHDTSRSIDAKFGMSNEKFDTHHTKIIEVENLANTKAAEIHQHSEDELPPLQEHEHQNRHWTLDDNLLTPLHDIDMKEQQLWMEIETGSPGRHGVVPQEKRVSLREYVERLSRARMLGGGGGGGGSVLSVGKFVMNGTDIDLTSMPNAVDIGATDVIQALNEPTGFPNRTDSTLSWVVGTRTLTIAPSNGSFEFWETAAKYTKTTSESIVIADTNGLHYVYYDAGVLTQVANPSHTILDDIWNHKAVVGLVYWNTNTNEAPILGDERHGTVMSGRTHEWLHDAIGSVYKIGLAASGYTEDTDSNAALTFTVQDGVFYDEDVEHDVIDGTVANHYEQLLNSADAEIPILYRDDVDGSWKEDAATTLPYKSLGAGRLAYNKDDGDGTFSQVEVVDNRWVSVTLVATNDWQYPVKMIQGQNDYTSVSSAIEDAADEILAFGNLPSPEMVFLYRFVMRTKDTFSGTKKAKIVEVTDFRGSHVSGASAVVADHGALGGLSDDDHSQYVLVDGTRAMTANLVAPGVEYTSANLKLQDTGQNSVSLFEDQVTATDRYLYLYGGNTSNFLRLTHNGADVQLFNNAGAFNIDTQSVLNIRSQQTDTNMTIRILPKGTGNTTLFDFRNSDSTSNYGTMLFQLAGGVASIAAATISGGTEVNKFMMARVGAMDVSFFEDQTTTTQRTLSVHAPNSANNLQLSHDTTDGIVTASSGQVLLPKTKLDNLEETSLSDPGADRVVFWDDSDTAFEFLTIGTGLTITTNDLAFTTKTANFHYPVGMGVPFLDGGANDVDMEWNWDDTNLHSSVLVTVNDDDQDGDWLWEIYLPDDFATFASDAIKYWYNTSDDTNSGVTASVTDGTDTFTDARQQSTSWAQVAITATDLTNASVASSAGSKLVIRVKADGDTSDLVYIGGFDIYYNKS